MRTKPVILGILNITEDSFSDGGKYLSQDAALSHGRSMVDADVLDIGAAASNPLAAPISSEVEIARLASVVPVFVVSCAWAPKNMACPAVTAISWLVPFGKASRSVASLITYTMWSG